MSYPQLLTAEEKLAEGKKQLDIPTVVCICGSMRFQIGMYTTAVRESLNGNVVVMPHVNTKGWTAESVDRVKARLDDLHRAKIRLADEILIVGDYVGDSTRAEIAYARSLGKPIRFTNPETDPERAGEAE